jgi:N-acetylneuraminic acid mutarotase
MRPEGIPADVCATIEKAMALDPEDRFASAEAFGYDLQFAQRHNGLIPDSMALSDGGDESVEDSSQPVSTASLPPTGAMQGPPDAKSPSGPPGVPPGLVPSPPPPPPPPGPTPSQLQGSWPPLPEPSDDRTSVTRGKRNLKTPLIAAAAFLAVVLLVVGSVFVIEDLSSSDKDTGGGPAQPSQPTAEAQANWKPITNARVAREAVATTESDGTIWIFGGLGSDNRISGRHEGYDPAIDNWKGGDDLPVPVQHAMAVTWQGNPVVLGGWRADGGNTRVATDRVWRVVNSRWVELPPLLQPRAAAAAAVVGNRIIVSGGVGANGKPITTTEVFDGNTWTLGAEMPGPRSMLGSASDGQLMYVVGGTDGSSDVATVQSYDPAANSWRNLPELSLPRSDCGVAFADGRLIVVGGVSGGRVLPSVAALDVASQTWSDLPDMGTARHGMAVDAVGKTVYAIGGASGQGDTEVMSSAEALKLAARKPQPASQWRVLPNAPTPRLMMAWTVLDNQIWIAGGMSHGSTLNIVQSYDPQTGAWQTQPSLPIPLNHATGATYRDEVVVIGGATDELAQASNKVFVFRDGKWQELPDLKHARAAAAAAVVGDKLIVVGGQNDKQLVPQTEVFDGNSWQDAPDLPTPREHLAAVSDGTYMYTVGGRFLSADKNSAAFERFDPESGKWEELVDMPTPRGSYGAAYIDGRIVAVGGEEPTQVLATVEMFDVADGKWTTVAPLNTPRHGEVVAAVGQAVYAIGGADRPTHEGPISSVEALDFS